MGERTVRGVEKESCDVLLKSVDCVGGMKNRLAEPGSDELWKGLF